MRYTALLIAIAACADPGAQPDTMVDAAVAIDATPDAAHRPQGGCTDMGNLPDTRTVTLGTNDPFPSPLGDELQDQFVGDQRTDFYRAGLPFCWQATGTAPTLVANPAGGGVPVPVWQIPTAQTVRANLAALVEGGDFIENVYFDVYGDAAADFTVNVLNFPDLSGVGGGAFASTGGNILNTPAAWTRYNIATVGGGSMIPQRLETGSITRFDMIVSGGAQIYLGQIILKLRRNAPKGAAP